MYIVLSRIDRIGIGSAHPLKILASFPYLWPGATKFLLDSLQQGKAQTYSGNHLL